MRRQAVTRSQIASVLIIVIILLVGIAYVLLPKETSSQGTAALSESVSAGLSASSASGAAASTSSSASSSSSASASGVVSQASSSTGTSTAPGQVAHVIIILMENEDYGSVIGNASAPYENSLASTYAMAGNYFAVAHPSLPNYLALVAGSTFGVNTDCIPSQCSFSPSVTTIASLLDSHGLTWREYAESMPNNCSQFDSQDGLYYTKHNPFVYFASVTGNNGSGTASAYCDAHVVPMTQFYVDLQSNKLPNYSFITPNICDDAHSCPLSDGDEWLATLIPQIISSSSFASTAIFIAYDEGADNDTSGGGGHVVCILVSPFAKHGYVSDVEYTHYSLLATVEDIFRLGSLGRNDTGATPMSDLFADGLP